MNEKPKVRIHEQVSVTKRRKMPRGLTERAYFRNRPRWTTYGLPDWLLQKNGIDVWATITASIVFGICGRMADVPEYD